MGEAIQHMLAGTDPGHGQPVVLLVQEKAGLLSVHHVHMVAQAVFGDDGHQVGLRQGAAGNGRDALAFGHALQFPDLHIVALVDALHVLAHFPQDLQEQGEQQLFALFDAQAEHLGHQHILEPVHGKARKAVGLAKDQAAGFEIVAGHDGLAVLDGVPHPPFEEGLVELVVGVPGNQAHPDLGVVVIETRTDVLALFFADHIHQVPVFHWPGHVQHFVRKHPGVAAPGHPLPFSGDGDFRKFPHFVLLSIQGQPAGQFHVYIIVPYGTDDGNRKCQGVGG